MSVNTLKNLGLSEADATHRRIGSTFIVDYGIIKKVVGEGVVTVEMGATTDKQSVVITNCILASFASSSFTVNIKPNVDDKVLVLFPKNYSSEMFDIKNNETIINEASQGYSLLGGIAILVNQFQDFHKNYIDFSDGSIELKLAYSKDEDTNLLVLNTNADGEITLSTNEKFNLNVNKEGEIELSTNDNFNQKIDKDGALSITSNNTTFNITKDDVVTINNGKSSITVDDSVTIDNGKATITIDSSGNVQINTSGKYTLSNTTTDLKSVIDGLATELENLITVGSPATQATSPASKATIATWRNTKLNLLLD